MATPLLITPDGKKIELSLEAYEKIQEILRENEHRAQRLARIDSLYGKYAGKTSMTQALLQDRKEELAREEAKLKRRRG